MQQLFRKKNGRRHRDDDCDYVDRPAKSQRYDSDDSCSDDQQSESESDTDASLVGGGSGNGVIDWSRLNPTRLSTSVAQRQRATDAVIYPEKLWPSIDDLEEEIADKRAKKQLQQDFLSACDFDRVKTTLLYRAAPHETVYGEYYDASMGEPSDVACHLMSLLYASKRAQHALQMWWDAQSEEEQKWLQLPVTPSPSPSLSHSMPESTRPTPTVSESIPTTTSSVDLAVDQRADTTQTAPFRPFHLPPLEIPSTPSPKHVDSPSRSPDAQRIDSPPSAKPLPTLPRPAALDGVKSYEILRHMRANTLPLAVKNYYQQIAVQLEDWTPPPEAVGGKL